MRLEGPVEERHLREATGERGKVITAAPEEKLPRVSRCHGKRAIELRLLSAIEPHGRLLSAANEDDIVPRAGGDDRLPDEEPVAVVAVEEDQLSGAAWHGAAAEAQVVARGTSRPGRSTRKKVGGHGA